MNRDDILSLFDQAFGVGKYPRGPAIALGEELIGVGRREAGNMLLAAGVTQRPRYAGHCKYSDRVYGDSVVDVAVKLVALERDGYAPHAIRDGLTFDFVWRRDNDATALFELQLLAGDLAP